MAAVTTKDNVADDILTLFIAILMFHSLPSFPLFAKYFNLYPYLIFGIAVVLLIYRKRILGMFNSK